MTDKLPPRSLTPQDQQRIASLLQSAARAYESGSSTRLQGLLEEVLEIDPDHAKAVYNLGILHRDRDEIFQAEVYLRRALRLDPDMIDAYQGLADILFGAKHLLPAARQYELALERAPNRLSLLQNLARTRLLLKDADEAERLSRRILAIDDQSSDAWITLTWALLSKAADPDETLSAAEEAVRLSPAVSNAPVFREQALRAAGRTAEADAAWSRLLSEATHDWDKARTFNEAYYWLNRLDRCRTLTSSFVAANPDRADGLKDLASLMMADGDFEAAQNLLDRSTELAADNRGFRMVRGLNAFRLGQYKLGLELYSARWFRSNHDKPWDIGVPDWDGRPLDGRLIIYCEQGIGDYVMFALMFSEVRKLAKSITIEVNARVASLFRRTFPDMRIIDRNQPPADWDPSRYRAKVAMGDLFLLLGADMENLPNREGFLVPEPGLTVKLRNRYRAMFPGKRLIGLSWRSGNRDSATIRSVDLSLLRPLFEIEDCAFISLQYGDLTRDLERLKAETGHEIYWDREVDPMQYLDPFTAQIAAMDLVISVDNSTVHFAGAAGKPCWVMLPLNSDWRWLIDRPTSLWYSSLELWRQQRGDGWAEVIDRIAQRLRTMGNDALIDATAELCLRCGETLLRRDSMSQAEEYFRWLLETGRHKAAAFHGIGKAAQSAGHVRDAVAILGKAVELAPQRVDYKADWAVALFAAGEREAGERLARALTRETSDPTALMAMGEILAAKGALDQSTDYFARVLRTEPTHVMARAILAGLQAAQGEDDLARTNFARLVDQAPDLPGPRAALAEIDLKHGRNADAGANFAWRFRAAPEELPRHVAMMAPTDRPKSWSGGKLRRKRAYLRAERSLLEQLVFARWLGPVAKDSRAVLAECVEASLPLLRAAFPDVQLAAAGSLTPEDLIENKIQIAGSLGDVASAYESAPQAWLPVDRAAASALRQQLRLARGERLIGLCWHPGPADHDIGRLQPLLDAADTKWLAIPTGPVNADLGRFLAGHGGNLVFRPDVVQNGLEHLAGTLAALDLVFGTDDICAALAGAAGRPVWKIAGVAEHWSWLASGERSAWHPTARIFRTLDEEALISQLRSALAGFGHDKL